MSDYVSGNLLPWEREFRNKGIEACTWVVFSRDGELSGLADTVSYLSLPLGKSDLKLIKSPKFGFERPRGSFSWCSVLPWWLGGEDPTCRAGDAGDMGSIPELERSRWRRKWQPTPVFLSGKCRGQRSLVDYSPWGRKESGRS